MIWVRTQPNDVSVLVASNVNVPQELSVDII